MPRTSGQIQLSTMPSAHSGSMEDAASSAGKFFQPSTPMGAAPSWTGDAFESNIWRALDPNPGTGGNESVSFETIPEPFRLTIKQFIWAVDQTASFGRRRAKSAGTARTLIALCRHFTESLHAAGVASFASAKREHVEAAHMDYCGLLNGEPITSGRAARYLGVLKQLHELGPTNQATLSDGLSFDPTHMAVNVSRSRALAKAESTPELSEDTGRRLMLLALDWVENKAEAVLWTIQTAEALARAKSGVKNANKTQSYALIAIRSFVANNPGFMSELANTRVIFGGGSLTSFLPTKRRPFAQPGVSDMEADCLAMGLIAQQLQLTFQGFCYVVCAGFNGWRGNEILSMDGSTIKETPAGFTLATTVRKTALNTKEAPDRPVPPIVAQTVASLAKINARSACANNTDGNGRIDNEGPIFRSSNGSAIDTHDMNQRITAAWTQFTGSEERITTHQFRRFFALFYLRRHQGNLDAIRRHFRHVSREMVWAYVKDGLNAKYLAKEKKALAGEIARSVVLGKGYTSNSVGRELKEARISLRFMGKTLAVEDAATFIQEQIEFAFMDVHAMEWGYCLLQNGQSGAACEGRSGPIESRAEPSTCGRCKFLCTGTENIPFWQQTALLHQEVASNPMATQIMRSESERLLSTASNILARHRPANPTGEAS